MEIENKTFASEMYHSRYYNSPSWDPPYRYQNDVIVIILVSLLLTLNIFHTFF